MLAESVCNVLDRVRYGVVAMQNCHSACDLARKHKQSRGHVIRLKLPVSMYLSVPFPDLCVGVSGNSGGRRSSVRRRRARGMPPVRRAFRYAAGAAVPRRRVPLCQQRRRGRHWRGVGEVPALRSAVRERCCAGGARRARAPPGKGVRAVLSCWRQQGVRWRWWGM